MTIETDRLIAAANHQSAAVLQREEEREALHYAAFLARAVRNSWRISGRQEPQLVPARVISPTASSEKAPCATALSMT